MAKKLKALESLLRRFEDEGMLETEQLQDVRRTVKKLRQALQRNSRKDIEAAINEIARSFLR